MNHKVRKEVEKLIKECELDCSVEEFEDEVSWQDISSYHELSKDFIREFKDEVWWELISEYQSISDELKKEIKKTKKNNH